MNRNLLHAQWRQHVALDVGTATTRMATASSPLTEQPSRLHGRAALHDGVVVDGDVLSEILAPLLERVRRFGIVRPFVLTCAPSDAGEEERERLVHSIMTAGAACVSVIPEPLAAAVGSNLDLSSPYAQMVVDIGEGVIDCAVLRSGALQTSCAIRGGCELMRRSIVTAAEDSGSPGLDDAHADLLMRSCGFAATGDRPESRLVAGAIEGVMGHAAGIVSDLLRELPHELGCEVIDSGIRLTGGGALIPGMRQFFETRTGISVTTASNPRASVVEGARSILPVVEVLKEWK